MQHPQQRRQDDPDSSRCPALQGGIRVGITADGRCLVVPEGKISKRNAAILADTLFLQASALTRFSLSG